MGRAKRTVSVLLLAGMILAFVPSGLWATSAVPEPGAIGIPLDPTATGTKVFGPLSVSYVLEFVPESTKKNQADPLPASASPCPTRIVVDNMFVVVRLETGTGKNVLEKVFSIDFTKTSPVTLPICFENTAAQVDFLFDLITAQAMPYFFGSSVQPCVLTGGTHPCWAVKSITDFLSSGTGAISMDIELAVK